MNKIISILVSCFLLASCATHITKPKSSPEPTKVRFSEFKRVEMKEAAIGAKFANGKANKRAAKKINEMLFEKMRMVLPNLHEIEQTQDFSNASARTLQITPRIKEIKFIGGAARFWGGIFSGSSAVLVQVEFRDSKR